MTSSGTQQFLDNFNWLAAAGLTRVLLQVASFAILARLVAPETFGIYATSTVIIAIAVTVSSWGFGRVIIRLDLQNSQIQFLFGLALASSLTFIVVINWLSRWISEQLELAILSTILPILSIVLVCDTYCGLKSSLAEKNKSFSYLAILETATLFLERAITLSLAYSGFGLWALIVGAVSLSISRFIFLGFYSHPQDGSTKKINYQEIFVEAAAYLAMSVSHTLTNKLPILFLTKTVGVAQTGNLNRAMRLGKFIDQFHLITRRVLFPTLVAFQLESQRFRSALLKSLTLSTFLSLYLAAILTALAEPFILIVMGDNWLHLTETFQLVCLMVAIRGVYGVIGTALNARGKILEVTLLQVLLLILTIGLCYSLAEFGAFGVVAAMTISIAAQLVASLFVLLFHLKLSTLELVRCIVPSLIFALIVFGTISFIDQQIEHLLMTLVSSLVFLASTTIIIQKTPLARIFEIEPLLTYLHNKIR